MEKAEKMFQRAVLGCEKVLGPDHLHTLAVVNDLNKLRVVVEGNENEGQNADSSHNSSRRRDRLKSLLRLRSYITRHYVSKRFLNHQVRLTRSVKSLSSAITKKRPCLVTGLKLIRLYMSTRVTAGGDDLATLAAFSKWPVKTVVSAIETSPFEPQGNGGGTWRWRRFFYDILHITYI